jgi:hypothetical protein
MSSHGRRQDIIAEIGELVASPCPYDFHSGHLVCDFCSGAKVYLPQISQTELHRVCDTCLKENDFKFTLPTAVTSKEVAFKSFQ